MTKKEYTTQFAGILTEGLSLGIIVVDRECRIIYWNPWLERHSNVKVADVIGQNILLKTGSSTINNR